MKTFQNAIRMLLQLSGMDGDQILRCMINDEDMALRKKTMKLIMSLRKLHEGNDEVNEGIQVREEVLSDEDEEAEEPVAEDDDCSDRGT